MDQESPQLPHAIPDGNPWPKISIITPLSTWCHSSKDKKVTVTFCWEELGEAEGCKRLNGVCICGGFMIYITLSFKDLGGKRL